MRGTNYGLKNGDILKASIVGHLIRVYINGIEKARVTDDTYKTGDPGIGEFLACDGAGGLGSNADFGFASFTARGLGGTNGSPSQAPSPAPQVAASPSLECFATSDLDRVFEDGYGSPGNQ